MQSNHSCKRIFHIPHFKKIPICVYALAFLVLSQKSESSTVKSPKVTFKSRVKSPKLFVKIQIYAPTLPLPFFFVFSLFYHSFYAPDFYAAASFALHHVLRFHAIVSGIISVLVSFSIPLFSPTSLVSRFV